MRFEREMYWKVKPREYAVFAVTDRKTTRYGLWYQSEENGVEAWLGKLKLFSSVADAAEYCLTERLDLPDDRVTEHYDLDQLEHRLPETALGALRYWLFFHDLADRLELPFAGDSPEASALYDALLLQEALTELQQEQLHEILKQGILLFRSVTEPY